MIDETKDEAMVEGFVDAKDFIESGKAQYGDQETVISEDETIMSSTTVDPENKILKQVRLNDALTLGTTLALKVLPMVVKSAQAKKNGETYKVSKIDMISTVVSSVLPVVSVIDSFALKGKIRSKLPLNDVRNVINLVQAYPSVHKATNNFVANVVNQNSGKPKIALQPTTKSEAISATANLVAPYLIDKITNKDLTLTEKFNSIMPIGVFGRLFQGIINNVRRTNPQVGRVYDFAAQALSIANQGTRLIGGAVKSTPNSTVNKTTNQITSTLNIVSEAIGVRNGNPYNSWGGNGGMYNGGYRNDFSYGGNNRYSF